jgi:hypothetical protein
VRRRVFASVEMFVGIYFLSIIIAGICHDSMEVGK